MHFCAHYAQNNYAGILGISLNLVMYMYYDVAIVHNINARDHLAIAA